jgi:hypothetical protein
MANPEFRALLEAGYSEGFLRTPFGSPTQLRQQYLSGDLEPKLCKHCGLFFQLPRLQEKAVLNAKGEDMRFMYPATVLDNGYCNIKCENAAMNPESGDLFGDGG